MVGMYSQLARSAALVAPLSSVLTLILRNCKAPWHTRYTLPDPVANDHGPQARAGHYFFDFGDLIVKSTQDALSLAGLSRSLSGVRKPKHSKAHRTKDNG